jgi:hypothetical protein
LQILISALDSSINIIKVDASIKAQKPHHGDKFVIRIEIVCIFIIICKGNRPERNAKRRGAEMAIDGCYLKEQ